MGCSLLKKDSLSSTTNTLQGERFKTMKIENMKHSGFYHDGRHIFFMEKKGKDISFPRWWIICYYEGNQASTVFFDSEEKYNAFIDQNEPKCYTDYTDFRKDSDRTMRYSELKALEKHWNDLIQRSKRAYERGDHEKERHYAGLLEGEIIRHGITCDWPGLYPCFQYDGKEFYTVESVINEISMKQ